MPQTRHFTDTGNASAMVSRHAQQQNDTAEAGTAANAAKSGGGRGAAGQGMPAWRRIEALKERRALKEALTDIWSDDPELDDDMFFPGDEGGKTYYRQGAEADSELIDESLDSDEDL